MNNPRHVNDRAIHLARPQQSFVTSPDVPAHPAAATLDYSRFLAFYEARTPGNTDSYWQDISGNVSGNGKHLAQFS